MTPTSQLVDSAPTSCFLCISIYYPQYEPQYRAEICKKNNISVPTSIPARAGDQNVFASDGYRDLYARRVTARK